MKSIFLTIAIISISINQVAGQVIKPKSGTTVTVFNAEDEDDDVKMSESTNVIKMGVFHIARGAFPLFYERKINNHFSAEVGAGFTFLNIGFAALYEEDFTGTPLIGPYLDLTGKFYPAGGALLNYYGAVNLRYSNYISEEKFGAGASAYSLQPSTSYKELVLLFGHQDTNWFDTFVVEYYFGFGVRQRSYSGIDYTGSIEQLADVEKQFFPTVKFGYKFGIGW